jgi:putative membrane protein
MNMKWITAALVALAFVACEKDDTTGMPETETTGTVQSAQQTTPSSATTTGSTGGTSSAMAPEDKEFIAKAGMGGLFEVKAGDVARQKGSSANVKSFAERMVSDHSKANAELAQLATAKGVALPTELEGEQEAAFEHLQSLTGAELDKAYMQHMVADHEKDVAEFEKASTSAQDPDVKAWAAKTLPTLREHLEQARRASQ